jgi:Thioesterase superfamily
MSSAAFEMTVAVLPEDIDEQNHVNNTVYLRWVQEVATAHWRTVASAQAQGSIGWVVLRHEIDYQAPACLGERSALGWAKPAGLGLNGSLKFEGAAIVNYCRTLGQSGVLSTPKPAGQSVYRRTCASSFRLELALVLVLVVVLVLERHRERRSRMGPRTTTKRELNIER